MNRSNLLILTNIAGRGALRRAGNIGMFGCAL